MIDLKFDNGSTDSATN